MDTKLLTISYLSSLVANCIVLLGITSLFLRFVNSIIVLSVIELIERFSKGPLGPVEEASTPIIMNLS
jgi:hypothetical protein